MTDEEILEALARIRELEIKSAAAQKAWQEAQELQALAHKTWWALADELSKAWSGFRERFEHG